MVVMDSVTAAVAARSAAAAAAEQQVAADVHRAWYESAAAAGLGSAQGHGNGSDTANSDLTESYFKGQNYFSQLQSPYNGVSQGQI